MTRRSYKRPFPTPPTPDGILQFQTHTANAFEALYSGRTNSVGDVTLTAGTSTTLANPFFHENSVIVFMPKSAAAAAIHPSIWVTPGQRTATINHSTAVGGEAYSWAAFG